MIISSFIGHRETRAEDSSFLSFVWGYGLGGAARVVILVLLSFLATGCSLLQPAVLSMAISSIQAGVFRVGLGFELLALLLLVAGASVARDVILYRRGEALLHNVRTMFVSHVLYLDFETLGKYRAGDLVDRFTNEAESLRDAFAALYKFLLGSLPLIVGALAGMVILDVELLAVSLFVIMISTISVSFLAKRIKVVSRARQESMGKVAAALVGCLKVMRTLRVFDAVGHERDLLYARLGHVQGLGRRLGSYVSSIEPISTATIQLCFVVIIGVGVARAALEKTPLPEMAAFLVLLFILVAPVNQLFSALRALALACASFERMREILEEPLEVEEKERHCSEVTRGGKVELSLDCAVVFRNVTFSYRASRSRGTDSSVVIGAVRSLSFKVNRGEHVAVVGASGSGKTTMLNLIARLYEPDCGDISFFGENILTLNVSDYRENIAIVEQGTPVLTGSLRHNLTMGDGGIGDSELCGVLERVGLLRRFSECPAMLEAPLGEGGEDLSGGEKQLLCLARALVRRPRLLLLDEVTSHLDGGNEELVLDALRSIDWPCTVISVTHRLASMVDSDRVLVMDRGSLAASGTHAELLRSSQLYRDLIHSRIMR